MSANIRISDAEWEVMKVVWDRHPITALEVIQRLAGKTEWNHRTIRTMLTRLVKKGALTFEMQGKAYHYRPSVSQEACVRRESRSFLARVFGGATAPMLVHFVKNSDLSAEEIRQLRKILAEKESE